jgi:hypothetical protein
MKHPDTEVRYINDTIGMGLFATKFIPKGTVTYSMDKLDTLIHIDPLHIKDPIITKFMQKYLWEFEENTYVLCWDEGKYVNHACVPNSRAIDNHSVAVRDIHPGEEITEDYGCYFPKWEDSLTCHCGHAECRKTISAQDKSNPLFQQKHTAAVNEIRTLMATVPQPILDTLTILNRYMSPVGK